MPTGEPSGRFFTGLCATVLGSAILAGGPALGQNLGAYYSGMAFDGLVTNQIAITQKAIGSSVTDAVRGSSARPKTRPSDPTNVAYDTGYVPSLPDRRRNLARFVERTRSLDPAGATSMAALFASTDVIAALGVEMAPYGLRVDDVADAYSAWWMSAWQAAHRDTSRPARPTAQAVRVQAANALAASPEVRAADRKAKQELAEALLIQAAMLGASQETYKSDAVMTEKLAVASRQGARAMGIDLDTMTLTEKGFVPSD